MTASKYSILRTKRTGGPLRIITPDVTYPDLDTASAAAQQAHNIAWDDHFDPPHGYRTGRTVTRRASALLTIVVAHPASATREDILDAWHHASRTAVLIAGVVLEARRHQIQERAL